MANYVHIPHILTGDNPLDVVLGDTRFYDKTVLSAVPNSTAYEPAVFPQVILDGITDWEYVMFGVMWEHFEDPTSPDQTQASLNDYSYGRFFLMGESTTSGDARFRQEFASAQGVSDFSDGSGNITNPFTDSSVLGDPGTGTSDGAEVLVMKAGVAGNDSSTYVDGTDGWDGYRLSIANLGVSGIDSADYNTGPPGGSGNFGLAIPSTHSQGGTDLYWHQMYIYGPGKYVRYMVNNKLAFSRRKSPIGGLYPQQFNNVYSNKPVRFKFFMRTENYDTVYSDEGTITDLRQGVFLDSQASAWEYNKGEDLPDDVTINSGTNTIDDVVYPNVALTQLTYPVSAKLGTPSDTTDAGFIYQGMKVNMPNNYMDDNNGTNSNQVTTITGATQANPVVITSASHTLVNGAHIKITGVVGMTDLNDNSYYAKKLTADTFSLYSDKALTTTVDGTGFSAYTSGGEAQTNFINTSITNNRTFLSDRIYNTNSAWCIWDYITDPRYGMGNMFNDTSRTDGSYSSVTSEQQYKNLYDDLHAAGLRSDELVRNDVNTADIKRYSLNVVLDGDGTKMETLAQLCSNMDAKPFFHNGYLRIYQDRPKTISGVVNQTNAVEFSYSGGSDRNRANQVYVKFNNPAKLFSQDAVYTEDREALKPPAASVSKDVIGFGITNKGQAIRHGRTMLAKEKNQDEVITFKVGMNATHLKPGDLIVVSNSNNEETRFGGRVSSINTSTNVVTLDENFDFEPTTSYKIYIQNGNSALPVLEKNITVHTGSASNTCTIENTTGLVAHKTDSAGAAFVIVPVAQDTFTYEIQRVSEADNEYMYEIGAIKYDEDKFGEIDASFISGFDYETGFPASYDEDV